MKLTLPLRGVELDHDLISQQLYQELVDTVPEQVKFIMDPEHTRTPSDDYEMYADIDPQFMGFVSTYFLLSLIIPRHWVIVDLGCAYAPQSYYFRHHKVYYGVDTTRESMRFRFSNTHHYVKTIEDYLKHSDLSFDRREVFAICNYVPNVSRTDIGSIFPNCFNYYGHGGHEDAFKMINYKVEFIHKKEG